MAVDHKGITFKFHPILIPLVIALACMEYYYDFQLPYVSGETTVVRCIEREREALLRFKQGLTATDHYAGLSSWGNADCCQWEGVECSNTTGHVTVLLVDASGLGGKISSALLDLHHLNHLDLSSNDFGGIRIPEFIGSIKTLHHLDLSDSNFSGIIPPQLGNLTNLITLDLSLNGNIWSDNLFWLSYLSLLSHLNLTYSNISDTNWLQHILKLPSLQELYLFDCMLTDNTSPAGLFVNSSSSSSSSRSSLSILDLSSNQLTSSTFDWLLFNTSTASLVEIYLSINQLDGPIPDAFAKLIFLEYLDLSDNKLEAGIPKSLGNLSFLESLRLSKNMLEGGVPKSLGNLSHLRYLDLSENGLGDGIDGLFGNLSCKAMETLYLSYNQFIGSMPDLRACSKLRGLLLDHNNFTGSVHASLGQLSKLESLDISYNSLQGTISEAHFIKLHNLEWLDLSFNSLALDLSPDWIPHFYLEGIYLANCLMGPSFPTWLQTQSSFVDLDISFNGISGEVPKWLWTLSPQITYLNLSHNHISGTIPHLLFNSITVLDVSSNKFSGPLPSFHPSTSFVQLSQNEFSGSISPICTISKGDLVLIDLSSNKLTGALPSCWENMKDLLVLNLNNNSLSGGIPHSLGSLSYLKTLHLGGNNLSGELPSTLKNCRFLKQIDFGGNILTGNIPPWLGESFANLIYLSLRHNRFHGGILLEICNLTQIQVLDLSGNNLSGKIPQCFNNFATLVDKDATTTSTIRIPIIGNEYIDYALVQWKRQESEYRKTLGLLKLIDLSSNRLVGNIPSSFSSLRGLISLNLSRNSLTGSIDPNIGQMEMLECLDLSRNQLSGEIPVGLAQLHFLAILDLANNNLSGKIPSSAQLQSFDESAYAGNNELCGKPLKLCPEDDVNTSINNEGENIEEKDEGFMSLSFMQEFGISMAFGFIVGFWGVVGSVLLKRSWRSAYFNFLDAVGDWLHVTTTLLLNKFRRH